MTAGKWTEKNVKEVMAPITYTADWAADCPPIEMVVAGMSMMLMYKAKRLPDDPLILRMQPWIERVLNDVNIIKQVMRGEIDIELAEGATEPTVKPLA